jgi:hypothetical protein
VLTLKNPAAHRQNYFSLLIEELKKQYGDSIAAERFNARYRALLDHHDELVSTSTVREIVFGILEGHKQATLSSSEVAEVNRVLDNISRIRMPTAIVGYATANPLDRMQHPTNVLVAFFADPAMTASAHSQHDVARKARFVNAMDEEIGTNQHWTFESAINAGAREAIAYTLNEMAAPITATDVRPHALAGARPTAQLTDAVRQRESMKSYFTQLGGLQEPANPLEVTADERLSRRWTPRRGTGARSVSPSRV